MKFPNRAKPTPVMIAGLMYNSDEVDAWREALRKLCHEAMNEPEGCLSIYESLVFAGQQKFARKVLEMLDE